MKIYSILILLSLTGVLLSGCGDDEQTSSAKSKQLNKLSGTWELTSVTMSGVDVTPEYSALELTLSGAASGDVFSYSVVGRPELSPWPTRGTWSFGSDLKSEIMRDPGTDDALSINYSVTDSQLMIEFAFIGSGYQARASSAEGIYVFTFEKK
jgi:hypothetical protein